ncbi:MAG: cobalamin-5-phosphate synthase [Frankiales bacterium]|nr:cobalamin-5-phosphate synthase [Frankiales bacterium]
MGDALRLVLTTFTVARVRGPRTLDRPTAGAAMSLAPFVGLALGVLAAALVVVLRELQVDRAGPLLPALGGIVVLALLTRGLHLDGLVDTADGLASYAGPQRARQIMKEPGAGALGVAVLLFTVLLQVAALQSCIAAGRGSAALVLAAVVGRLAVVCALTPATPAAAPDGLGALVAGTVRRGVPGLLIAITCVLAAGVEAIDEGGSTAARAVQAGRAVLAVILALGVGRVLRRHAVRRLGGISGDVLGALIEITAAVVLVGMALELPDSLDPG